MKKLLMIGSALAVLSTSAHATQARLLALGMNETDNEGMYYIQDQRNIFLNAAYVNVFYDYAVLEWGTTGTAAGSTVATVTSSTTPKAQGGVFKKFGDMVYGVYFGNESNTSSLLRIAGTSAAASFNGVTALPATGLNPKMLPTADNQVDLFVGGGSDLKWGANVTYSADEDETRTSEQSAYAVRLGVIGSGWDAHANISLNSEAEAVDTITIPALGVAATSVSQKFEGKLGLHVGGSVEAMEGRVFGYVKKYGWEQTDSFAGYSAPVAGAIGGQSGTVKGDFTSYYLGYGRDWSVNNTDKIFASLTAKKTDINLKFATKGEVRHLVIPVTLGYEAKATDWLTLRGSVVQNLWGQRDNKRLTGTGTTNLNPVARNLITNIYGVNGKARLANSTVVNAGASLTFGQFSVDGLIGTSAASRAGTIGSGTNAGILSLDNLESSVGMTYKF